MAPTAAFFDLDKTIIAKSSTFAFSKPFQAGGLISRRAVLRSAYAQFVYAVGGADHDQMEKMRQFMSQLCAGWDVATVREIVAETLFNIVDPIVYDEAVSLMEEHRVAGRDVVIVSASGTEIVEPIGHLLGVDDIVASRLEIEDGKYTGEISYYAYAEEKAHAILDLAENRGYDLAECYGYSDSVTDVPMLEVVGFPHAVTRPRAAPDRGRARLAGAGVHQAGRTTQPSAAATREAGTGSPRRGWCRGRRRRSLGERAASPPGCLTSPSPAQSEPLNPSPDRRTTGSNNNSKAARDPGTHAAIHPSYREPAHRELPGAATKRCTLSSLGSRVSGGTQESCEISGATCMSRGSRARGTSARRGPGRLRDRATEPARSRPVVSKPGEAKRARSARLVSGLPLARSDDSACAPACPCRRRA